jgi:exosortase
MSTREDTPQVGAWPIPRLRAVRESVRRLHRRELAPTVVGATAFAILFWEPIVTLGRDWWSNPEAGHGLLLGPVAIFLAWRRGVLKDTRAQPLLGIILLVGAVLLRYLSGLAAELFTLRMSLLGAIIALIVFAAGVRQLSHWWLPVTLLFLSIPLPAVLLNSLSLPLQLEASAIGTRLLEWRQVPTALSGNIIHLPGRSLFVSEACSGLRSITALLSLGVLIGGIWLRTPWSRLILTLAAIPVAMILNGIRVFLTGFFVYYLDPRLGDGFMHYTEGWALFVAALAILAAMGWLFAQTEHALQRLFTA